MRVWRGNTARIAVYGVFGTAPLQLCVAKYFQLHKLRSKKKVKLEINFTFFLEHLKRYSSF
jgi:hypothetical protein